MRPFTTTLLVPATALLATLLLAAKPTSPRAFRAAPRPAAAAASPCPSYMAPIGDKFCIDQFEASTVEIGEDGTTVRHSPFLPVTGLRVKAISKKGLVPQAYISRDEAEAACEESGKRLCEDDEWVTACKGPNATRFPYGNERKEGWCVDTNRAAPLAKLFANLGAARYHYQRMTDPRLNQIPSTVAPTGSLV